MSIHVIIIIYVRAVLVAFVKKKKNALAPTHRDEMTHPALVYE